MKKIAVGTGTPFQRQEVSGNKRKTQVKPNANRGWPIKPVYHIRQQLTRLCPNSFWTPTSQNADGAPPYWAFQRYGIVGKWQRHCQNKFKSGVPRTQRWQFTIPLNSNVSLAFNYCRDITPGLIRVSNSKGTLNLKSNASMSRKLSLMLLIKGGGQFAARYYPQRCDLQVVGTNPKSTLSLQWRQNERDGVLNHRRPDCFPNRLFRRRSKKTSKLRITGLRGGNPLVTGGFPSQRASNAENVSIWWHHHVSSV